MQYQIQIDVTNDDIPRSDTLKDFTIYQGPVGVIGLDKRFGEYELIIGKLRPSGKTYISLFVIEPNSIDHPIPEYITVIIDS